MTDIDGKRYFDGMSGLWCVNVGHGREEIASAAYEQMKTIAYLPLIQAHVPAIQLAEKINSGWKANIAYSSQTQARMLTRSRSKSPVNITIRRARERAISLFPGIERITELDGSAQCHGQSQRKLKYEPLGIGF